MFLMKMLRASGAESALIVMSLLVVGCNRFSAKAFQTARAQMPLSEYYETPVYELPKASFVRDDFRSRCLHLPQWPMEWCNSG